jgi:hypothetical protein
MRKECMQAVAKALGRDLNQAEAKGIDDRVNAAARRIAQKDPKAWMGKSKAEKLAEAGQEAALSLIGEAKLKAQREALQIAADSRTDNRIDDLVAAGFKTIRGRKFDRLDALERLVAFHGDQKALGTSLESEARAVSRDFMRQLIPVMEASNPKWFGLLENIEGVNAIMKEIYGEDSGVPEAKAGAKIWKDVAEQMRTRFNRAGGDIGKLDDWGAPQHHSQIRVAKAGREEWLKTLPAKERAIASLANRYPPRDYSRAKWVADILPKLKREKYVDEDGTAMTDAQLTDFLKEAWLTIATGGANKSEPGQLRGNGMRRESWQCRALHPLQGRAELHQTIRGSTDRSRSTRSSPITSRASQRTSRWSKRWDRTATSHSQYQLDRATKEAAEEETPAFSRQRAQARHALQNLYNEVAGKRLPIASERLANELRHVSQRAFICAPGWGRHLLDHG